VRYTIPLLVLIRLFITPVVYSSALVRGRWPALYGLNLMTAVLEGFRWTLLDKAEPPGAMLLASAPSVPCCCSGGSLTSAAWKGRFADVA
jgi:lipopolysaccharide transport system permease protein